MNIFSKQVSNEDTFPIHAGIQALDLRGHNGTITWFPTDEGQPRVVARKEVRGMKLDLITEFLAEMKVVDSGTNGEMILWVDGPDRHTFAVFSTQVHFSVFASPEQIKRLRAKTSNGRIAIHVRFAADLQLTTSNGAIELAEGMGVVELKTSNGRIEFGKLELTDSSFMRTSNGRIAGQVEFPAHGSYRFDTSNGQIALRLPADTAGSFRAKTSNGRIEFSLGADHLSHNKVVELQRGEGPSVSVSTSNGGISLVGY